RGTCRTGEERERFLGVRPTGGITQPVQILPYLAVADEVVDALVEVGQRDVAGRSEVPLDRHVDVVRLQRQQARGLGVTVCAEAQQHRTVGRVRGRSGVQVAVG